MASNPPPEPPPPVEILQALDLPPREAIRFLEEKGYRTTVNWTEMWEREHASAFTVAKVAKVDLLVTIRASLLKAQAEGIPFEQWQAGLQPELERAGWWGRVQDRSITGTERAVIIGPRRLRTIYDTNMRMARATALWDRIQASKATLPFLRYSAVMDGRTRPLHALWHGTILPVDHPWWLTHFPPNGWRCRCTVVQLNARMMERRGWTVSQVPTAEAPVRPFWRRGAKAPVFVPPGIDPGFGYNPGIARAAALAEKAALTLDQVRAAGMPEAAAALQAELTGLLRGAPRLLPARPQPALSDLARAVRVGPTPNVQIIELGRLSPDEARVVREVSGIDVSDYQRIVRNFEIRKTLNRHGEGESISRQLPVTPEDFDLLPEIYRLGEPFDYRNRNPAKGKPNSISWRAVIDGRQYTAVEYILERARRFSFQSLWKSRAVDE
ncbi:phage minor head protein [Polymorphobacter sp.]|uniref:phage minor head protein n=1 Tax=Polymorphobacter sp. TaxID=1909290 RepID=UPI003F6F81A3